MDGHGRAAVVVVHDIHTRGARWEWLTRALELRDISLHAPEFRYDARPLESLGLDIGKIGTRLRGSPPLRRLFLLGEGAGAVAAASCALRFPSAFDGLICAGVALEPTVSAMRLRMLRMLAAIAPRTRGRSTARSFLESIRAGEQMRASVPQLSLPLLVLHGGSDSIAKLSGSEFLHQRAGSRDKTLLIFEGYHHGLLSGVGHEVIVEKVVQWIVGRLDSPPHGTQVGIEYINDAS